MTRLVRVVAVLLRSIIVDQMLKRGPRARA